MIFADRRARLEKAIVQALAGDGAAAEERVMAVASGRLSGDPIGTEGLLAVTSRCLVFAVEDAFDRLQLHRWKRGDLREIGLKEDLLGLTLTMRTPDGEARFDRVARDERDALVEALGRLGYLSGPGVSPSPKGGAAPPRNAAAPPVPAEEPEEDGGLDLELVEMSEDDELIDMAFLQRSVRDELIDIRALAAAEEPEGDVMGRCTSCGREHPVHYRFCLGCGAELPGVIRSAPGTTRPSVFNRPAPVNGRTSNPAGLVVLVVLVIALIALGAAVAFFVLVSGAE